MNEFKVHVGTVAELAVPCKRAAAAVDRATLSASENFL
jgi:hypothetical protein